MGKLLDRLSDLGNDAKEDAALKLVTALANETPVDTGLHVSNWRVGLGAPVQGVFAAHARGKGGSTAAQNRQATIALAAVVLRGSRPGQPVFVSNAAPAIVKLNSGSSQQAPAGFVERAIVLARQARKIRSA